MSEGINGTKTAQQSTTANSQTHSKQDHRFWLERVYLPSYVKNGVKKTGTTYHVRIQAHGERRGMSLNESQKRAAAKAAAKLYLLVKTLGWKKGLLDFREEIPTMKTGLTLGDYLEAVESTGLFNPKTFGVYRNKVRRIAAELGKIRLPKGVNKHDHFHGGHAKWRTLVDAIPLEKLIPEEVSRWRSERLAPFRGNPAKLHSATRTANSCIRAGKALFKEEVRQHLAHLKLPDPPPFVGLKTAKEAPNRYRSEIGNPEVLLAAGVRELAGATPESEWQAIWRKRGGLGKCPRPGDQDRINATLQAERRREAFKVLVLALVAGLRRGEIDRLQWSQVDLGAGEIRIEATDCFAPKADSAGSIPLDDEIIEVIRGWQATSTSRFVVNGVEPISDPSRYHYRCNRAHGELIRWLHAKGITASNALHSLRKEYGSIVCEKAGIYVASRLLRHKNITTTAAVYADDRGRVTPGLSLGKAV